MPVAGRRVRRIRPACFLSLLVLLAQPLPAQTIVDAQRVEFVPSTDNDTLVNGVPAVQDYSLNLYLAGSSTVAATVNLGKPASDPDGYIRMALLPLLTTPPQMGVNYEARVFANGPGGSSASAVSNTFVFTSMCGTSTLGSASANVAAGTSSGTVAVTAACSWGSISNANWITVTSGASGTGSGSLGYSVSANSATSPRSGTLTIAGNTFTINQAAATCSYSLAATTQAMGVNGGSGSVSVTSAAGCAWTATSNTPSWLTVTSGASGNGSGSVGFSATPNNQTTARSGTLTIGGRTFTVTESACSYTVSPVSVGVAYPATTGKITVTTSASCSWGVSSTAGWVTLSGGGTGSSAAAYTLAANSSSALRVTTLVVAGQTVTVTQAGATLPEAPKNLRLFKSTLAPQGGRSR